MERVFLGAITGASDAPATIEAITELVGILQALTIALQWVIIPLYAPQSFHFGNPLYLHWHLNGSFVNQLQHTQSRSKGWNPCVPSKVPYVFR